MRDCFDDGGLANTFGADQQRIVFLLPTESGDDAINLALASNHRLQLPGRGHGVEIDAECRQWIQGV